MEKEYDSIIGGNGPCTSCAPYCSYQHTEYCCKICTENFTKKPKRNCDDCNPPLL